MLKKILSLLSSSRTLPKTATSPSPRRLRLESLENRELLAVSAANDLIVVHSTDTQNRVTLSGAELNINFSSTYQGSVTIVSLGTENLTIDADTRSRVFSIINSSVGLAGLTITGGYAASGGGIYNDKSSLVVTNCTISDNSAIEYGGGIFSGHGYDNSLVVTDSTIAGNSSLGRGGGIYMFDEARTAPIIFTPLINVPAGNGLKPCRSLFQRDRQRWKSPLTRSPKMA